MNNQISSLQNEKIKNLVKLQKKPSERKEQGLFVVEGRREISLAISNNIVPRTLFLCEDVYEPDPVYPIDFDKLPNVPIIKVSSEVYSKIAYRGDTQGIMMTAENIKTEIASLKIKNDGLYLLLESVEKPGNLGAVFRTADAAGISGIVICGQSFDIYNPNVIRSSLGCIFTVPFALTDNSKALDIFKKHDYQILAAHPEGKSNYSEINYKKGSVIVLGTESEGLTSFWKENATQLITIPMMGQIDSLNISVSAAVITYEARRQRNYNVAM
jgi:RNA methyltransferase, TrmH family